MRNLTQSSRSVWSAPYSGAFAAAHSKRFATFLLPALAAVFIGLAATNAPAESLLLSGATVHTVSGETLSPGQVLIQNGKIAAVGATISPSSAQTIDLNGQHLYPGIIAMDTLLGLTEIGAVRATQDSTEVGEFTPE